MYDGVFRLRVPEEVKIVGFADDVAVVVQARHLEEVQIYANEAIRAIKIWLENANLKLAEHKTEVVLISGRRAKEFIKVQVGRSEIVSTDAIKYLGVLIDSRLNFKQHMEYACLKATNVVNALSRMMPNIGGPKQSRRILLSRVANSILLYGSPIWYSLFRCTSRKDMMSIFRRGCLRVCSGYRTISLEASCVIASIIPLDITAREFSKIYEAKSQNIEMQYRNLRNTERRISLENWQRRWQNSSVGRWTYKLIPNIEKWVNRKYGDVNYNLTQFLSGHGGYRSYLNRFGHDDSPMCPVCPGLDENAEHVVFVCHRFHEERTRLEAHLGCRISPQNIVDIMLTSELYWDRINVFIIYVNESLRREEQLRKQLRVTQSRNQ